MIGADTAGALVAGASAPAAVSAHVRAVRAFWLGEARRVEPGQVVEVPAAVAVLLVQSRKAERAEPPMDQENDA